MFSFGWTRAGGPRSAAGIRTARLPPPSACVTSPHANESRQLCAIMCTHRPATSAHQAPCRLPACLQRRRMGHPCTSAHPGLVTGPQGWPCRLCRHSAWLPCVREQVEQLITSRHAGKVPEAHRQGATSGSNLVHAAPAVATGRQSHFSRSYPFHPGSNPKVVVKPACRSRIVFGYVLRHVAERLLPLVGGDGRQALDPKLQRRMQGQLLPQVEGQRVAATCIHRMLQLGYAGLPNTRRVQALSTVGRAVEGLGCLQPADAGGQCSLGQVCVRVSILAAGQRLDLLRCTSGKRRARRSGGIDAACTAVAPAAAAAAVLPQPLRPRIACELSTEARCDDCKGG